MTLSLQTRLLLAASLALAAFLGITGLVLDNAFYKSAESALKDRLKGHIYALLAAAELDNNNLLQISDKLPDPRFHTTDSGLYAYIYTANQHERWHSQSSLGIELNLSIQPKPGQHHFYEVVLDNNISLLLLSYGVEWETDKGASLPFYFHVAEDLRTMHKQIQSFRRSLWIWLGAAALLLLAIQGLILRWGLTPLRQVATDLLKLESGERQQLEGDYPKELEGLTNNINTLITSAHTHLARYRDTLGNLAHSLKTPLAILRGAIESDTANHELGKITKEQLNAMNRIIDYQLQRAATAGRTTLAKIRVKPVINKIISALDKVYADKGVTSSIDIDEHTCFSGDEGDLMEIIGNLLDNAYKWCHSVVSISATNTGNKLTIQIGDNGPGMSQSRFEQLLKRGTRGDDSVEGHGIGLAMVNETVNIYQGKLELAINPKGGTLIYVTL